jgi:drug/metabolite transporter (DMT)-like permease
MDIEIPLAMIVAIVWGVFPFAMQYALQYTTMNVVMFIISFTFFASVCLHNILFYTGNFMVQLQKVKQSALIVLVACGFLVFFINNILYFYVINTSTNLVMSLSITTLSTLVTLMMGIFLLQNALSIGTIIGVVLVSLGMFVMTRFSPALR